MSFKSYRRFHGVLLLALCAGTIWAHPAEDAAKEFVRLAYDGRFAELPLSKNARGIEAFQRSVRDVLRVRTIVLESVSVTDRSGSGPGLTVDVDVALRKNDRQNPDGWMSREVENLRLHLTQYGEVWRVDAVQFADDEFGELLIRAPVEQRQELLDRNPRRITRGLARAVYKRGLALTNTPDWASVASVAETALKIAIAAEDRGGEALAIGLAGIVARMSGNLAVAARHHEQALRIAESLGDPDVLARAWFNLGKLKRQDEAVAGRLAAVSRAEECFDRMLPFAERAEDPGLLSRVLGSKAGAAISRSDYFTARHLLERKRAVDIETDDKAGQLEYLWNLHKIYSDQLDFDLAVFHFREANKLAEAIGFREQQVIIDALGEELLNAGRYAEARAILSLPRTAPSTEDAGPIAAQEARNLENLARIAAIEGEYDEAECLAHRATELYSTKAPGFPMFTHTLTPHFLKAGRPGVALRLALMSIPHQDPITAADALTAAAEAYRALGDSDRASSTLFEAIEIREESRQNIAGGTVQRVRAAERTSDCYELAAELELHRGDPMQALVNLERGRGRMQVEIVEYGRSDLGSEGDGTDQQTRSEHERTMARLQLELERAERSGDAQAAAGFAERLRVARSEYETFVDGLAARSQRRKVIHHRIDRAQLEMTLQKLPDNLAVVEYLVADDRLHLFVIRRERSGNARLIHREVAIPRKALESQAQRFATLLSQRSLRFTVAAAEMYKLLIAPIEGDLAGAQSLLVVRDDGLWRIPFGALKDGKGSFLIERMPIAYAASVSVYVRMSEGGEGNGPSLPAKSLLAVGNPTIDYRAQLAYTQTYHGPKLPPLPHAEIEVDALRKLYGGASAVVLKGSEATEMRTKAEIGGTRTVHFATHGMLDDRNPMYSRLALARSKSTTDDGWLEAWEVAGLAIDADLVVLSACDTARGRIGGGEGVIGMAWAFYVAGANSTVATEWKVTTASTSEFMIAFHQSLSAMRTTPFRKARALRDAQLKFLRSERFRHPFYWAPFILLGNPS